MSAKCGVFAETDIVNLLKSSVPAEEILNSLADAIVIQNLSVLAKGNPLQPGALLLGGPNYFLPFLMDCWRAHLMDLWKQSDLAIDSENIQSLVQVPENALFYAAWGAAIFAIEEKSEPLFIDIEKLGQQCLTDSRLQSISESSNALFKSNSELEHFKKRYQTLLKISLYSYQLIEAETHSSSDLSCRPTALTPYYPTILFSKFHALPNI